MNEWTKRYYNEAYLRRWHLGQPDERVQKNAVFLLEQLRIGQGNTLLDVGCGQGRYSLAFAKSGVKVTGLDASDVLISEAKCLAQEMGLSVEWVLGDMRKIPFQNQFDGVASIDAFGFFQDDSDNQKAVMQMAKALKPGARLVIAILNGLKILNNFRKFDREERKGFAIKIKRDLLPNRRAMRERLCFIDSDGESTYERYQRLFSAEELSELGKSAGLLTRDVFGSFRGEQFDPNLSEKIVLVTQKGGNAAGRR